MTDRWTDQRTDTVHRGVTLTKIKKKGILGREKGLSMLMGMHHKEFYPRNGRVFHGLYFK